MMQSLAPLRSNHLSAEMQKFAVSEEDLKIKEN
jgi:hypothetical protein